MIPTATLLAPATAVANRNQGGPLLFMPALARGVPTAALNRVMPSKAPAPKTPRYAIPAAFDGIVLTTSTATPAVPARPCAMPTAATP